MIDLTNQTAKLNSITPRQECHGEDRVPAFSLGIAWRTTNDLLSELDSTLKFALYKKDEGQDDLLNDPGHVTKLKYPLLKGPISWDWSGAGYEMTIHQGVSGKGDITIQDVVLDKLKIDPQDGGELIVSVKADCRPTPMQMGELCTMLGSEISISLTPPSASSGSDKPLFDDSFEREAA